MVGRQNGKSTRGRGSDTGVSYSTGAPKPQMDVGMSY